MTFTISFYWWAVPLAVAILGVFWSAITKDGHRPGKGSRMKIEGSTYRGTTIWFLEALVSHASEVSYFDSLAGRYRAARPLGWEGWRHRLRAAWLVWTGRADVVIWPEDEGSALP